MTPHILSYSPLGGNTWRIASRSRPTCGQRSNAAEELFPVQTGQGGRLKRIGYPMLPLLAEGSYGQKPALLSQQNALQCRVELLKPFLGYVSV